MSRILIVEDDTEIVKNLILLLREEGFASFSASGRKAALEAIERETCDLVLLDVALPDGNGYSLCNVIKRKGDIPVIFLTAMGDEASIVTGFDLGADDYVSKPFKPLELVSRIKNARAFDTSINQKVLQSLIAGLFFCQLFCFKI